MKTGLTAMYVAVNLDSLESNVNDVSLLENSAGICVIDQNKYL